MQREDYGQYQGQPVHAVWLRNAQGLRARLITFGARLTELHVPDRNGSFADIVLGFDSIAEYVASDTYAGATCGRYANRIAGARFSIDGTTYQLDANEGPNQLHGGSIGFDRKVWQIESQSANAVSFTAESPDGEMGYPGHCTLRTIYSLGDDNRLGVTMQAATTRPTVMNMAHHSYFNLAGQGAGNVLAHELQFASRFYTPVDAALLTTGEVRSTGGTAFDFSIAKPIGRDIAALSSGYDHNWCLDHGDGLRDCARAYDPASGRRMSLQTNQPGVQLYTAGHLDDRVMGKAGKHLCRFAGFALETQKFPGTPGFGHFPSSRLDPGQIYDHRMVFHFTTDTQD